MPLLRRTCLRLIALSFCVFFAPGSAAAHEFLLVPQSWHAYAAGQTVPFSLSSSHAFMKSEELEDAASVTASYKGRTVDVQANAAFKTYDGAVELQGPGAAVLRAHRKPQVWTKTTTDVYDLKGQAPPANAIWTRKYEKFCKTLLPVDGNSDGYDTVVGDKLEIVPVDDPLQARVGDVLTVRVLLDGKPVGVDLVKATYDGFTDSANAYAYVVEPYGEGLADVKVSAPGLWMIRVQHMVETDGKEYDKHVMRASLIFPVSK